MSVCYTESETVSLLTGASNDAILTSSSSSENNSPSASITAARPRSQKRISFITKRRKMSRRANLIGICGVSSLCILLLIATAQHRPLPAAMAGSSASSGAIGSGSSASVSLTGASAGTIDRRRGGEVSYNMALQQQQTAPFYNLTATMTDVLTAQRSKILLEMENFEYPSGLFGVDAEKLSDMTPETGGTPVRSIVITTWRSGSTFLGDILNAMPANYYHYEPLLDFGIKQIRDQEEAGKAIHNLKNLLNCDYTDMEEYLDYGRTHTYLFEHNERLWSVCKEFPHFCWRAKFLTAFCRLFPMQSMKTVRLRLESAEELLDDKSLNVRVLLLVRDPRGTVQSRKHRDWCPGNPDCDRPENLCNDLVDDYKVAEELSKKFPARFRTLRYEDLSINPYEMTQEVLQFFGLPFDPMVEQFLDTHTKVNIGGVSSTYRDSKSAPFHWKQDLMIDEVNNIQNKCTIAMDLWGYRKVENFDDYQRTFDPLILPAPFT